MFGGIESFKKKSMFLLNNAVAKSYNFAYSLSCLIICKVLVTITAGPHVQLRGFFN